MYISYNDIEFKIAKKGFISKYQNHGFERQSSSEMPTDELERAQQGEHLCGEDDRQNCAYF